MDSRPHIVDPSEAPSRASSNGSANPNSAQNLTSTTQLSSPIPISTPQSKSERRSNAILTGIYVVIMIYLGMIVAVLPWKEAWTENSLVLGLPNVRAVLGNNFMRGLISGLGLVDIWFGISEAASFRVMRKS
jgi:hypothetical protein